MVAVVQGRKKGNTELCSEPSQNKVFLTLEDGYMSISMDKRYDLSPYLLAKHSDRHSFTDELDSFPTKYDWESQVFIPLAGCFVNRSKNVFETHVRYRYFIKNCNTESWK